jgi:hypothetical protein
MKDGVDPPKKDLLQGVGDVNPTESTAQVAAKTLKPQSENDKLKGRNLMAIFPSFHF